jgi:hypothetical protein
VRDYKSSPDTPVYRNKSKEFLENPNISNWTKDIIRDLEKARAERYFGRSGDDVRKSNLPPPKG